MNAVLSTAVQHLQFLTHYKLKNLLQLIKEVKKFLFSSPPRLLALYFARGRGGVL
jgi:hypothetical protein